MAMSQLWTDETKQIDLADNMPFSVIGKSFIFVGRDKELKKLKSNIENNCFLWFQKSDIKNRENINDLLENFKRLFKIPVITGCPGIGKTTFIQRGTVKCLQDSKDYKEFYS